MNSDHGSVDIPVIDEQHSAGEAGLREEQGFSVMEERRRPSRVDFHSLERSGYFLFP